MSATGNPLLSVGLPVYNGLPYLQETLESIRDGEFEDYELIVCDNASTDATGELVQDFASRDARIRYVRNEKNIGAARNYNKCLDLGRGKYFRWVASDDIHSRGAIARCVEAMERDPALVLAFPQTRLIDGQGKALQDYDDGDGWSLPTPSERFWFALGRFGLSNAMFGVIRADVLRGATLQGDYPSSDLIMQADLAIRGRFEQVAGEYYYRRMHDGCTDNLDAVALAQFYNPGQTRAFDAKMLRIYRELAGVVYRAPVPAAEKLRLWTLLGRRVRWDRDVLARELGRLIKAGVRRRSSSLAGASRGP